MRPDRYVLDLAGPEKTATEGINVFKASDICKPADIGQPDDAFAAHK